MGHCHYTRVALNSILMAICNDKDRAEIIVLNKLSIHTIKESENLDYLIVSGYPHMSFHYSLNILLERFYRKSQQLIVLTEPRLMPLIVHFLAKYCHYIYFIQLSQSCMDIQQQLQKVLFSCQLPESECVSIRSLLTRRELYVMNALFSGVRVSDLCVQLTVSEKTISSHKLKARDKLQYFQRDVFHHTLLTDALQSCV